MTEIVLTVLLTATAASMGFTIQQLWKVSNLVNRIDERTISHERRLADLEQVA